MDAKQIRDFENECEIMRCPFLPLFLTLTAHAHARTHTRTHARATTHLCHRGDSKARSPYILYFYGSCVEPQVCIVVEYCMRGSLYEVMSEETFNLTWERSLRVYPSPSHLHPRLHCSLSCGLPASADSNSSLFPPCARSSGRRSWQWRSTTCTSAQLHPLSLSHTHTPHTHTTFHCRVCASSHGPTN
jgi:hypothetical protein